MIMLRREHVGMIRAMCFLKSELESVTLLGGMWEQIKFAREQTICLVIPTQLPKQCFPESLHIMLGWKVR